MCSELFSALDKVEGILENSKFLTGDQVTEADVRLFMVGQPLHMLLCLAQFWAQHFRHGLHAISVCKTCGLLNILSLSVPAHISGSAC